MAMQWFPNACRAYPCRHFSPHPSRLPIMALVAIGLSVAGCSGADPADKLGRYTVTGELVDSCAESGLLAMPVELVFVVDLHRVSSSVLRWTEGAQRLTGSLENDRSFVVGSYLRADMRSESQDDKLPECLIQRYGERRGSFADGDGAGEYSGFEGQLGYQFVPTAESDCADLLQGENAIAQSLPCSIGYEIKAERDD